MGRAADRPEWLLQPYDLIELFPRLAALAERATERDIVFQPANVVGYFGPHQVELAQGDPERVFRGCPAGHQGLGIEADGGVKGCPSLPSEAYRAGTTRDASLRDLLSRAPELRFTRDDRSHERWGYCARCYYGPVCQGGCSWMAHALSGRRGNNPYCHHRALELRREGFRERVVQRERAPGRPFDHGRFEIVLERWDGTAIDERPTPHEPTTDEKRRRLRVVA
jgi:radical SAM protein with 4Fe4S-binding SPASM domain